MTPELQQLLLQSAKATHQYWTTVRNVVNGLEQGEMEPNQLDHYAELSRELSRQAVELHEREGEA